MCKVTTLSSRPKAPLRVDALPNWLAALSVTGLCLCLLICLHVCVADVPALSVRYQVQPAGD